MLSDICKLPDGSYLIAILQGTTEAANVSTFVSVDDGDTWTRRTFKTLEDEILVGTSTGAGTLHTIRRETADRTDARSDTPDD